MKAAVLQSIGSIPIYTDFPEPTSSTDEQILVNVKASSIKQLDLHKAAGKHYTHHASLPVVVGMDGVAILPDGQRIYAMGLSGMMAEKAIVQSGRWINVPDGLSDELAAALPNFLVGSDVALRVKGEVKPGDIVFVNGATGATGMMAVQMAKYHQASTVIATGRNPQALEQLKSLGADITISLDQPESDIIADITKAYKDHPFNIVIDYLWGRPAAMILEALAALPSATETKMITVGEMAGHELLLKSSSLRSRNIVLLGSGMGSFSPQVLADYLQHTLPEIFAYAATGKLVTEFECYPLADVADAWLQQKGIVILI